MISQSMCTCSNHLGLTCIASHRTPNQQADPLETKLSKYSINYLNSSTKTTERRKVMEAININTGETYLAPGSEKAQAIPLYCLPGKKAIHGLPQYVEEKIREIDASNKSNQEKDKEKKKLEDWKSKAVAQYSEDIIFNKILKIAKEKDEECLVLTGYKSETYLCSVRERGKATRSSPTDPLNEAEKDVAELLGLDLDVTQVMSDIMAELPNKVLNPSDLKNNDGLKKTIKTVMFEKKMRNTLETLFRKTSAPLNESTLNNVCEYSSYVYQLERASLEVDHLTIFPHQKIILQVETKSVMDNPLSKVKEAATQCNKFCHLFSKCHGDILLPGYTFIKVVAIPMIENQSKLVAKSGTSTQPPCDSCKSYIWTQILQKLMSSGTMVAIGDLATSWSMATMGSVATDLAASGALAASGDLSMSGSVATTGSVVSGLAASGDLPTSGSVVTSWSVATTGSMATGLAASGAVTASGDLATSGSVVPNLATTRDLTTTGDVVMGNLTREPGATKMDKLKVIHVAGVQALHGLLVELAEDMAVGEVVVGVELAKELDEELGELDEELGELDEELGDLDEELGELDEELGGGIIFVILSSIQNLTHPSSSSSSTHHHHHPPIIIIHPFFLQVCQYGVWIIF